MSDKLKGVLNMAKRGAVIDMGIHKPLGSSWRGMDTGAYSRSYEPESRPEFQCFVSGQKTQMQATYDAHVEARERHERVLLLKQKMIDKGLL